MKIQLLNKTAVVILIVFMAFSGFCDFKEQKKVKIDRLRDSLNFVDLLKLESGDDAMPRDQLMKYLQYFLEVSKTSPQEADAHAMAGFCYFHLGDLTKATLSYQTAIRLSPQFFGFHYNLGALWLLQNRYSEAMAEFKNAFNSNPQESILFLRNSKIFIYIIYKAHGFNDSLVEKIKNGYALSAYYAAECLKRTPHADVRLRVF